MKLSKKIYLTIIAIVILFLYAWIFNIGFHEDRDRTYQEYDFNKKQLVSHYANFFGNVDESSGIVGLGGGGYSASKWVRFKEQIVIEVKKTRKTLRAKELGEQLIVDIDKYKEHSDCKTLLCFVYDPEGWIANPRGIETDLNRDDSDLPVKVLITPTGL